MTIENMIVLNKLKNKEDYMKYKYIIWDWNGTLYNDVQICIDAMNELLRTKGYNTVLTTEKYREVFCFPVKTYYEHIGFDFNMHPFEVLAEEYIEIYSEKQEEALLFPNVNAVLDIIRKSGAVQTVISACEEKRLADQINYFGIMNYFSCAIGTGDNFAVSKIDLAKAWLSDNNINPDAVVFIGDTTHDYEVASAVGCDCILVCGGHQSIGRLEKTGAQVADNIEGIIKLLQL